MDIILTPLAMRVPNSQGVYALSRLRKPRYLSVEEFSQYTARPIRVSFEPDCLSNPQTVPAYGFGFGGWYLAEFAV